MSEYTPHPAKAFFAVLLGGAILINFLNLSRETTNPELARIASGANTAGVFLSAIIVASTIRWRLPIFIKVALFHIGGACLIGYLNSGQRGLAYALGTSLFLGLVSAALSWIMLSKDWIFGSIVFWGLAGIYGLGLLMYIFR